MKPPVWWSSLSFFWKAFLCLSLLMALVVSATEMILEPWAERLLADMPEGFGFWHEAILWAVSIIIPSLICGFIFSGLLTRRLGAMADAANRLARGDFAARIEESGRSQDAFTRLGHSFNAMAASLEKLLHNERRLLMDISHELRSPLARMSIALALLPLKKDGRTQSELAARLEKEVEHMGQLVGTLLEQGRDKLSGHEPPAPVDVAALLREIAEDIRFQGLAHGKDVHCETPGHAHVYGQARHVRAIFSNVAANALFYTPSGGSVDLRLERVGKQLVVTVRDYGPGVPEAELEDIFRAFYRVDDSRTRSSGGAGLGLALAKNAALSSGGSITARNVPPGLEVRIELPEMNSQVSV